MKCPTDQTVLAISERNGIEIDYCPTCRGVWLDRGELDKLIASGENTSTQNRRNDNQPEDSNHQNRQPERESFLSNLFDF